MLSCLPSCSRQPRLPGTYRACQGHAEPAHAHTRHSHTPPQRARMGLACEVVATLLGSHVAAQRLARSSSRWTAPGSWLPLIRRPARWASSAGSAFSTSSSTGRGLRTTPRSRSRCPADCSRDSCCRIPGRSPGRAGQPWNAGAAGGRQWRCCQQRCRAAFACGGSSWPGQRCPDPGNPAANSRGGVRLKLQVVAPNLRCRRPSKKAREGKKGCAKTKWAIFNRFEAHKGCVDGSPVFAEFDSGAFPRLLLP
jgi:hypothetical protein